MKILVAPGRIRRCLPTSPPPSVTPLRYSPRRGIAGSGAAGGLAGGLWSVFDAELRSGSEYVLNLCDFDESVAASTAVIVGEGRLDRQTQEGKLISSILRRAGSRPVFAVVGSTSPDLGAYARHFAAIHLARNPPKCAGPVWQSLSISSADPPIHRCAVGVKDLLPGQGVDSRHGNR